jgi:hypothetical protein
MQSNDAIEVVATLGGRIREVTLFPDAIAVLASNCGCIGWSRAGFFKPPGGHPSLLESDVTCS